MATGDTVDFVEQARDVADITAAFIDTLIADGWDRGAVLAGVHSGATARLASLLGVEFTAAASEQAARELRGGYHA